MRYFKTALPVIIAIISGLVFNGCYTQFSRPGVDTEEGYYYVDEPEQPVYEDYEVEEYYDDYPDTEYVNYHYYDIDNYYYPSWGGYDYRYQYVDPFYSPYDWYFYTGFYPAYWWYPSFHRYYPGWYISFWYSDYYWHSGNYWYNRHYYQGGWVSQPMNKRPFSKRTPGLVTREPRRVSRQEVVSRDGVLPKRVRRPDATPERIVKPADAIRSPDRRSKPVIDGKRDPRVIKGREGSEAVQRKIPVRKKAPAVRPPVQRPKTQPETGLKPTKKPVKRTPATK
ncbi:MAG: hypothetical protein SCK70_09200, partial [bacterium]|nr:hypothetical protein [bacterium]